MSDANVADTLSRGSSHSTVNPGTLQSDLLAENYLHADLGVNGKASLLGRSDGRHMYWLAGRSGPMRPTRWLYAPELVWQHQSLERSRLVSNMAGCRVPVIQAKKFLLWSQPDGDLLRTRVYVYAISRTCRFRSSTSAWFVSISH